MPVVVLNEVFNAVFMVVVANQRDHGIWCQMYMAHSCLWRHNRWHATEVAQDRRTMHDHWVERTVTEQLTVEADGDMARSFQYDECGDVYYPFWSDSE